MKDKNTQPAPQQLVELAGRHRLIAELISAGLEVSIPIRDAGIDLIAYTPGRGTDRFFTACPIQMKAAVGASFSIHTKYKRIPNLILAYVWHVNEHDRCRIFAMTYHEAFQIAEESRWTKTNSWSKGAYVTTKPSTKILEKIKTFEMTPEKWWNKIAGIERKVSI
jgi:hypothetical protein